MPDKDDKNSGHTSTPQEYDRSKTEVSGIEDGHTPSLKDNNDREATAPRNTEDGLSRKELQDRQDARNVPATKQG